jgi:hypothetical protein
MGCGLYLVLYLHVKYAVKKFEASEGEQWGRGEFMDVGQFIF